MPPLPSPGGIPQSVFNTLLVKELKPVLMYFNILLPNKQGPIPTLKGTLINSLRDALTTLYAEQHRNAYESLLHYICVLLRKRRSSGSFLEYQSYSWHGDETYQIPTGPLSAEAQNIVRRFGVSWRRPESVGVPSAVPGGLVNPQFQNSPAAPPIRANSSYGSYSMTTADIEKVMFCDYGLLMPKTSIVKPFSYSASPQRLQSKMLSFKLTTDIIDLLQENGKDSTKGQHGIHLYIANMASVCTERRLNVNASAKLYMPYRLQLKINGALEPTLLQASGMYARPIDVTSLVQQKSDYTNRIDITYMSKHPLIIALILTIQHTPQSLSAHIHKSNLSTVEQVRRQFFKAQSDDDDIIDEGALVNLKCPLGLSRIKAPCRAKQCQHLQCFDCVTFLQFYSKIAQWKCPVCSIAIKSWHDLIADSYFEEILQNTSENDEQVYIDPSGDWKLKKDAENLRISNKEKTNKRPLEVEDVDAVDLSDLSNLRGHGFGRNKQQRTDVVDLTLDSDEDDCEDVDDLPPMTQEEIDMLDELETDELSSQTVTYSTSDPRTIALSLTGQLTAPNSTCTAYSPVVNSVQVESTPTTAVSSPSSLTNSSARSTSLSSTNASTATNTRRAQPSGTPVNSGNTAARAPMARTHATSTTAQNTPRSEQTSSLQSRLESPAQPAAAPAVSNPVATTPQRTTSRSDTGSSPTVRFTANGMAVSSVPDWRIATRSSTGSSNTSASGSRRGREALSRRATSSGAIQAPTVTINTTVAGIDVAGANARSIQRRMSSNTQSMPHTTTRQNTSAAPQNTAPALARGGSDIRATNSRAVSSDALVFNSLPASPIGMRSPTNGHQACVVAPCPVHSQRSPLVGISSTYSSLFLHSQVNSGSPNGSGGAARPNNSHMPK